MKTRRAKWYDAFLRGTRPLSKRDRALKPSDRRRTADVVYDAKNDVWRDGRVEVSQSHQTGDTK